MIEASRYHTVLSFKTKFFNFFRGLFLLTGLDRTLARLPRNKLTNLFVSKFCPPNYLYKQGTVRNFTSKGLNYSLDISDTMGHETYFAIYNPALLLLYKKIKKGMTVFDVGANIGSITLNFAKLVESEGKVFSFEPDALNYSRAKKNISLNKFSNITLYNHGLGSSKETAYLYNVNENNRGMLRVLNENAETNFPKSEIEIDTLDNIIEEKKASRPDIIKIDVEGYELKVLKGGEKTLQTYKPVLFIELDDNNLNEQGNSARELVKYLYSLGYTVTNALKNVPIDEYVDFKNCHFDIICMA